MSFRAASHPALVASRRVSATASQLSRSSYPPLNPVPVVIRRSSPAGLSSRGYATRAMAPVPNTMKAVYINKTGGTEVLEHKTDVPVPTPIDGNILVKNDFVGVNFIDTYFRTGLYKAPQFPYILGREGEGTVVAVGEGDTLGLEVGDRVAYMAESAYAEFTTVPAARAVRVPPSLAPGKAAAALLQGLTALTLVREAHPVKAGDWVLVHAAAGGTGLLLCQLLRAIGANTIGTVSTEAKAELARAAGASHVVVGYARDDVLPRVHELTGGQGVAAVFDGVGKSTFDLSLECVARKGSLVSFGNASGAVEPFTIARLAPKNIRLLRPQLFGYVVTHDEFAGYSDQLFGFIRDHAFDVRVHDVYPLSEVGRAHLDLEGRKTTGKLLVDPSK